MKRWYAFWYCQKQGCGVHLMPASHPAAHFEVKESLHKTVTVCAREHCPECGDAMVCTSVHPVH